MKNIEVFFYIVDELKSSDGYISITLKIEKKFIRNDFLAEDIIEKLSKYNLIQQSKDSKWMVRKKQSILDIPKSKLVKIFEGKSLEKPKWQTIDFYMNESIKYLIGAIFGIILAYITYRVSR